MRLDLDALQEPVTRILTAPGTDLSTISARRVRKALLEDPQYAYLGLTAEGLKVRRADVDQVIATVFEEVNSGAVTGGGSKRKREADGDEEGEGEEGGSGDGDGDEHEEVGRADGRRSTARSGDTNTGAARSLKKKKSKKSVEESDAALARKLSTEINSRSRRGASLAAGPPSPRKAAKRKPKKSTETIDSEEVQDGVDKPKKRSAPKGGFAKEYTLR